MCLVPYSEASKRCIDLMLLDSAIATNHWTPGADHTNLHKEGEG